MTTSPDDTGNGAPNGPNPPGSAGGPPVRGNPSHKQFEAGLAPPPDLDANVAVLKSSEMRRMNLKAIGFLAALVALMALAATWMFNSLMWGSSTQRKKPSEVVSVPAAPSLPPPAPPAPAPRAQPIAVVPTPPPALPRLPQAAAPRGPSLLERRIMDSNSAAAVGVNAASAGDGSNNPMASMMQQQMAALRGLQGMDGEPGSQAGATAGGHIAGGPAEYAMPGNSAYMARALDKTSGAQPLIHPDAVMTRGTYIRCVLETHIVTDVPGFTSCIVTEPVYSFTGKRLLLPKGSKMLGKYDMESSSDRVAVIWDRILTPNGIDVNMASPGIDNLGGAGHPGYRDAHWGSRIGAALLISLLSDAFSYEAAKHSPANTVTTSGNTTVIQPWQSNTAQTLQSLANMAVRRAANRPDTITINQGVVVYVYVARDVDFSGVLARS
jgi:type IV secretion system protein VirB10